MQRAKAMAFFGNKVSSSEAESIGLIYKCVADEAFESEVEKISSKLAAMPTLALGLTKVAFHEGLNNDLNAQLKTELDYQFIAAESNDYKEGVTSFLEKRVPVFKGN